MLLAWVHMHSMHDPIAANKDHMQLSLKEIATYGPNILIADNY